MGLVRHFGEGGDVGVIEGAWSFYFCAERVMKPDDFLPPVMEFVLQDNGIGVFFAQMEERPLPPFSQFERVR